MRSDSQCLLSRARPPPTEPWIGACLVALVVLLLSCMHSSTYSLCFHVACVIKVAVFRVHLCCLSLSVLPFSLLDTAPP